MRKVVVNTTPLIALSHVGLLHLLKQLYGEIIIPEAVYQELAIKKGSVCEKEVNNSLSWIRVKKIENQMAKQMYKTILVKALRKKELKKGSSWEFSREKSMEPLRCTRIRECPEMKF